MGYTFINISKHEEPSEKSYWKLWLVGIFAKTSMGLSWQSEWISATRSQM